MASAAIGTNDMATGSAAGDSRPARRPTAGRARIGVRGRLFAAFGAAAIGTLVACGVAFLSFESVKDVVDELTQKRIPEIVLSQSIAKAGAEIAATAPVLAGSATKDDLASESAKLTGRIDGLQASIFGIRSIISNPDSLSGINDAVENLGAAMKKLELSVDTRLKLAAERDVVLREVAAAHDRLSAIATPMVDDVGFNLVISLGSVTEKKELKAIEAELGRLAEGEVAGVQAVLSLVAEANRALGLMTEARGINQVAQIGPLTERYVATAQRARKHMESISKLAAIEAKQRAALGKEVAAFFALGEGPKSSFALRRAELDAVANEQGALGEARRGATALSDQAATLVARARDSSAVSVLTAEDTVETSRVILAVVAVLSIIIAVLVAWLYVGRNLVGRLVRLGDSMRAIAGGDLKATIPSGGNDEIADMATALVVFRDTAADVEATNARAAEERASAQQHRRKEINALADEFERRVLGAVESVGRAAETMRDSASSMARSAGDASGEIDAVGKASEQASTSVRSVATSAEQLAQSIQEIAQKVEHSSTIAAKAVEEAKRTDRTVASLADAGERIGQVVDLIRTIAGQTNLLALNATIEAARAGEAGKGFAVVASEVKNLANQTAKATEDITVQISAIQGVSQEAIQAIKGIGTTISEINAIANTIAAAVQQQGSATRDIANSVQVASQGTEAVSGAITRVAHSASESGKAAAGMLSATDGLARESNSMRGAVDAFLVKIKSG